MINCVDKNFLGSNKKHVSSFSSRRKKWHSKKVVLIVSSTWGRKSLYSYYRCIEMEFTNLKLSLKNLIDFPRNMTNTYEEILLCLSLSCNTLLLSLLTRVSIGDRSEIFVFLTGLSTANTYQVNYFKTIALIVIMS